MDLNVLFENDDYIVAEKPQKCNSESAENQESFCSMLSDHCKKPVFPVHRLDFLVGGVMVYAKNKKTAAFLTDALQKGQFEKQYVALAQGNPPEPKGTLVHFLFFDRRVQKSFPVAENKKNGKKAILHYEKIGETILHDMPFSLLKITLETGRTHQIRCQLATVGMPLFGDGKYGSREKGDLGLFCFHLSFPDPKTGKKMDFSLPFPSFFTVIS